MEKVVFVYILDLPTLTIAVLALPVARVWQTGTDVADSVVKLHLQEGAQITPKSIVKLVFTQSRNAE